MRCQFRLAYLDAQDIEHLEPPCCTAEATHVSCQPYVGTPTCAKHACRCATLIADGTSMPHHRFDRQKT